MLTVNMSQLYESQQPLGYLKTADMPVLVSTGIVVCLLQLCVAA